MAEIIELRKREVDFDLRGLVATVARWEATMPLTYHYGAQALIDGIEYLNGRRDLPFIIAINRRAIDGLIVLYDIAANDEERETMRKSFQEIIARERHRKARLAPYYAELHEPLKQRLREHKMFLRCGLETRRTKEVKQ
jgi:hypothetical protein